MDQQRNKGLGLARFCYRRMEEILDGIEGIAVYQYDIIVAGKSEKEHDERFKKGFRAIHAVGMKLQRNVCSDRKRLNSL